MKQFNANIDEFPARVMSGNVNADKTVRAKPIDYTVLLQAVREQMSLDWYTVHGPEHWMQVASNGQLLAQTTGADPVVVRLFALFHDARRLNEWKDPEHGFRGGELARAWCGVRYELDAPRLDLLVRACRVHTSTKSPTGDPTIDTCVDADRLDLARVGMMPDPRRLLTEPARILAQRALDEGVSLECYRLYLQSFEVIANPTVASAVSTQ